jgi:hypothetical protein
MPVALPLRTSLPLELLGQNINHIISPRQRALALGSMRRAAYAGVGVTLAALLIHKVPEAHDAYAWFKNSLAEHSLAWNFLLGVTSLGVVPECLASAKQHGIKMGRLAYISATGGLWGLAFGAFYDLQARTFDSFLPKVGLDQTLFSLLFLALDFVLVEKLFNQGIEGKASGIAEGQPEARTLGAYLKDTVVPYWSFWIPATALLYNLNPTFSMVISAIFNVAWFTGYLKNLQPRTSL